MTNLRWGVIGLGVGLQHSRELAQLPGADLVAICDSDPPALAQAASEFPDCTAYERDCDLIESGEIDAVVVASYDNAHAGAIIRAIEKGLHVFAEKPIATSRTELASIRTELNRSPTVRMTTNTLLRRSPRFSWLKSRISAGDFGKLFHVEGDYLYGRIAKLTHGWRGNDPDYSVTLGGAIHIIDLLMWLVGERPDRVVAIGSNKGSRDFKLSEPPHFLGDDFRIALLEFSSGLTAKVSANFACVLPHFHRLDVFGSQATFLNLPGSRGAGTETSTGLLYTSREPSRTPALIGLPYPGVTKGVLLPQFNSVISRGGAPDIPEQEVLDAMAVCLAIDESRDAGSAVEVQYEAVTPRQARLNKAGHVPND